MPDKRSEPREKGPKRTHDEVDPPAGQRDLDYGHAFGTQKDRSEGGEPDYLDDYSDGWQDSVPDRGEREDGDPDDA